MSSEAISDRSIALIIEGDCPSNELICSKLREAICADCPNLRKNIEADIFTYDGSTLVLAYPVPPLRDRVSEGAIRLHRM